MSGNKRDFHSLKRELLEQNRLYVDPDFPPSNISLTYSGHLPATLSVTRVEWKRPKDIMRILNPEGHPKFVAGTLTRSDLDQGMLGDCWFIAAASVLLTGPRQQFERVVPLDQSFDPDSYAGIFRFNFWWYGEWTEVIIDDYLPTNGTQLIYCSNWEQPEEFWAALLEKACAKLYGNYEALSGGKVMYGLVDMTGGLGEIIEIANKADIPENLYKLMKKISQMNSMLGASIRNARGSRPEEVRRQNGLYTGHAYGITAIARIPVEEKSVKLLRLRNPFGRKEWLGPWSDDSPQMKALPKDVKERFNMESKEEGEFWISYRDFIDNFDEVQICHLQPDLIGHDLAKAAKKRSWTVTQHHDAWIRGVTAGGCGNPPNRNLFWKNPQFHLHLKDTDVTDEDGQCTVVISLMEKEKGDINRLAVGFTIFKVKDPQPGPMDENQKYTWRDLVRKEQSGVYMSLREIVKRFTLEPGYYVIIPSTFEPHKEGKFLLRIYTEMEATTEVLDEVDPPEVPVRPPKDTVAEIFEKTAGEDGKLDYIELGKFIRAVTTKELDQTIIFNDESCRSLHTLVDIDQSGFINLDEAKQVLHQVKSMAAIFRKFDVDRSGLVDTMELGTMLKQLGFPVNRAVLTSVVARYGSRNKQISLVDFIIIMAKLLFMHAVFKTQEEKTEGPKDTAQFTKTEEHDAEVINLAMTCYGL